MPYEVKWRQVKYHKEIYLFLVPTVILIGLFIYYPAASGIYRSFFRWNGADIKELCNPWYRNYLQLWRTPEFWQSFKVAIMLGVFEVLKMSVALATAVCIHRCFSARMQFFYRILFVIPMVIPPLIVVLVWKTLFFEATSGFLNQFLKANEGFLLNGLCRLDSLLGWGGVFQPGVLPAWLGHPELIVAACIIWGFPWVGTFAVLITLAKLQGISRDVYEAAEIDGIGWFSKFTRIEFPLITGSLYIQLVLLIIGTIKDAGMILALAGMSGGPGGRATVPALFMLRQAFLNMEQGFACAIGIVLTIIVMFLQKSLTWAMTPAEVYHSWNARLKRFCTGVIFRLPLFLFISFATHFLFLNTPLNRNYARVPVSAKHEWVAGEDGRQTVNIILKETEDSKKLKVKAGRDVAVNLTLDPVVIDPNNPFDKEQKLPLWTVIQYPKEVADRGPPTLTGRLATFFGQKSPVKKDGYFTAKYKVAPALEAQWKAAAKEAAEEKDRNANQAIGTTFQNISFAKQFQIDKGGYLDNLMWMLWCVLIGLVIEFAFRRASNTIATLRMRWNEAHFDKDAAFKRLSNPWFLARRFIVNAWLRTLKHAFIWMVLFFAFLPLFLMVIVSFKTNQQFYANPTTPTLPLNPQNWVEAWTLVMPSVSNSVFISTLVTGFSLIFALCSAYFFARQKMPMSGLIWNAILILMMMPMIANLVPLFRLLVNMNLINTLSALILVGCAGGQVFSIFVLRTFVQELPRDLYEAAEIDGANHFQQLWRIVVPLSGPIMGTVGVQLFIGAWNDFIMPLIILRDAARLPVMVQILRMNGEYIKIWGPLMAGYALTAIPIILIFIFSMKLFVRGLTEGAIKG